MESRRTTSGAPPVAPRVNHPAARASFSAYLRRERETRGITLDHIARVTRIPLRSLERLEEAAFEELPADVFVRGFLRSYARCIGFDVEDAVQRYVDCGQAPAPVASPQAAALLESMAALAPESAARRSGVHVVPVFLNGSVEAPAPAAPVLAAPPAVVVVAPTVAVSGEPDKGAKRRGKRRKRGRHKIHAQSSRQIQVQVQIPVAAPIPAQVSEVPVEALAVEIAPVEIAPVEIAPVEIAPVEIAPVAAPIETLADDSSSYDSYETVVPAPPASASMRMAAAPSLVIDDDDPDRADRQREERASAESDHGWRSFLPQSLLDNDRRSRQGGLTLAVIILLIVATLTLSYLMRRPSTSGEGITKADEISQPTIV